MRIYTAHVHPSRQPKLLLEGWSWAAFLFGPLWLLVKGAWIAALLDLAAFILVFSLVPPQLWGPCTLGLALLTGLLGRDLVRWSWARRGYALAHVVAANDADAALVRFYTARPDLMEQAS